MEKKKMYKPMENVLNTINSQYISLPPSEIKRNNCILKAMTPTLEQLMKSKCPLFSGMFERTFYGGSYYDNLKVGNPNEFDLDFVLNIPVIVQPKLSCTDHPGFMKVKIMEFDKMLTRVEKDKFLKLKDLLSEGDYLSVNRVLTWMERTINLALNELPQEPDGRRYLDVVLNPEDKDKNKQEKMRIWIKLSKGFPAFTLRITGKNGNNDFNLDVDLVPCFQFGDDQWPDASQGYRKNPVSNKNKFLIVPKKPKGKDIENSPIIERYWRLSFQEQERELIKGHNTKTLKPAIKLLKKLRDRQNHKIASYFIKTLFLWALEEEKDNSFWAQPLSCVFMTMLERYAIKIAQQDIPYYWNSRNNLVGYLKDQNAMILTNIAQFLKNMFGDIEHNLKEPNIDPFVVGKYLLAAPAYEKLRGEVPIGKKVERSMSNNSTVNLNLSNADTVDSPLASSKVPPLISRLGFGNDVLIELRGYIAHQEQERQKFEQIFLSECKKMRPNDDNHSNNAVMNCLTKIDAKIDKLTEKVDRMEEDSKIQKILITQFDTFSRKIAELEGKMNQLQLENKKLKEQQSASNNVDQMLCVTSNLNGGFSILQ